MCAKAAPYLGCRSLYKQGRGLFKYRQNEPFCRVKHGGGTYFPLFVLLSILQSIWQLSGTVLPPLLHTLGCGTPILSITFGPIVGNTEHFAVVGRASAALAPCGNVVRVHFIELIDSALVRVVPHCAERAVGFGLRLCRARLLLVD